jgi:hypothetical protein
MMDSWNLSSGALSNTFKDRTKSACYTKGLDRTEPAITSVGPGRSVIYTTTVARFQRCSSRQGRPDCIADALR